MKNMTGVHISLQTFFQGCILKKWIHLLQKKDFGKNHISSKFCPSSKLCYLGHNRKLLVWFPVQGHVSALGPVWL